MEDRQRPTTSRDQGQGTNQKRNDKEVEQRALEMLRQAETAKARIYDTPGEDNDILECKQLKLDLCRDYVHSAMVDEHYSMIGGHMDEAIKLKIRKNEYVDFSRLIAKDRVAEEDDNSYKMIIKGGRQFWVPNHNNQSQINSFNKWEMAFRVFTDIYLKSFPDRASEWVQYNHLIHSASQEFAWNNVYNYDKDFRIHISMFPARSWAIILQQAWVLRLKGRLSHHGGGYHNNNNHNHGGGTDGGNTGGRDRHCRRFQKGRCSYGANCRFEHKCKYCNKWGHGQSVCCKMKAERTPGVGEVRGYIL